jgi:cyclophilin family peptidyl-prolyl cis-trans isomerase
MSGTVTVAVHVAWAPQGAMHFYQLVMDQFYDDSIFFRVLPWMAQFGLPLPGHKLETWGKAGFLDDAKRKHNRRGRLVFNCAGGAANHRATQAFFLTEDKTDLDSRHYAPFAEVIGGMDIIDGLHSYETMSDTSQVYKHGNAYLKNLDPNFSNIKTVRIVRPEHTHPEHTP